MTKDHRGTAMAQPEHGSHATQGIQSSSACCKHAVWLDAEVQRARVSSTFDDSSLLLRLDVYRVART
jgi:hypothetical protein